MTATAVAVRRLTPGYRLLPPPVSDEPVLLPGVRELDRYERQMRDGIELDAAVLETLEKLAAPDR